MYLFFLFKKNLRLVRHHQISVAVNIGLGKRNTPQTQVTNGSIVKYKVQILKFSDLVE